MHVWFAERLNTALNKFFRIVFVVTTDFYVLARFTDLSKVFFLTLNVESQRMMIIESVFENVLSVNGR